MSTAADRVEAYLDQYDTMLGLDPEQITGANGVSLAPADLRTLIDQARKAPDPKYGREARTDQEPTTEDGHETHPAYGMIGASRVSQSPPGGVLFDSDVRHQHYVVLRIDRADRQRRGGHDRIHSNAAGGVVEVAMSEAQWASFVSSMNTSGVPCTLRRTETEGDLPGLPFASRLELSHQEVQGAADKGLARIAEALTVYEGKKTAQHLRDLHHAIENAPANMAYAAKVLTEHAEDVVQKARVDIEAIVVGKAQQMGLDPGDVAAIVESTTDRPAIEGNPS